MAGSLLAQRNPVLRRHRVGPVHGFWYVTLAACVFQQDLSDGWCNTGGQASIVPSGAALGLAGFALAIYPILWTRRSFVTCERSSSPNHSLHLNRTRLTRSSPASNSRKRQPRRNDIQHSPVPSTRSSARLVLPRRRDLRGWLLLGVGLVSPTIRTRVMDTYTVRPCVLDDPHPLVFQLSTV